MGPKEICYLLGTLCFFAKGFNVKIGQIDIVAIGVGFFGLSLLV
jgi:hypothetical protein